MLMCLLFVSVFFMVRLCRSFGMLFVVVISIVVMICLMVVFDNGWLFVLWMKWNICR